MLDSTKYPVASADDFNTSGSAPHLDAPGREAVAAKQVSISVRGAAWAEYHLLLGDSSPHATRIEREIRTLGGAPTMAILLARWCAEEKEEKDAASVVVHLNLVLGRDPNARLLRRELEGWAARLPNLRLNLQEDEAAPEVAYRILMWPQHDASTCIVPQVLQCGEIDWRYEITGGHQTVDIVGDESVGDEVGHAALMWAILTRRFGKRRKDAFLAALRCWNAKTASERVACDLSWREVEAEAARTEEAASAVHLGPRAG